MRRASSSYTSAGRDAGLRRLRTVNRLLIGVAVAGTGLLADVAAQAFPGHKRVIRTPVATVSDTGSGAAAGAATGSHSLAERRHRHNRHRHRLAAPAHPPASSSAATTNVAPPSTQATTAAAPPATQPASPPP
ncbi:MAG: hypothetical protein ACRDL5_08985, partial [Solirubrobacteraceae bacterium]